MSDSSLHGKWSPVIVTRNANVSELTLSRVWADARLPPDLRLTDGRRLHVIYPGVWSNSNGPDFLDAMLEVDGRLVRGHVEIHLRASDWDHHRHAENPAYATVALHVVGVDDRPAEVRGVDGSPLATLELGTYLAAGALAGTVDDAGIFARLGTSTCLPTLAVDEPEAIRRVLHEQGWSRLVEKQLRFGQALSVSTASEVLYRGLLDALGYASNRKGMEALADRLPLALLESVIESGHLSIAVALLLGTAGFLPLDERLRRSCGLGAGLAKHILADFERIGSDYAIEPLPASAWSLNRVRPNNHPAVRLASLASLVERSAPDGLLAAFLSLPLDGGASWDAWLAGAEPGIGSSRRRQIVVNVLAPFAAAYADVLRDEELAETVADLWERLPGAVDDRLARAARAQIVGTARFPVRLALEEQGLHQIYRNGCRQLRCFECPIAALAMRHERWPVEATAAPQA